MVWLLSPKRIQRGIPHDSSGLSSNSFREEGMTLVGPNKHIRTHPLDQQPLLNPKPEKNLNCILNVDLYELVFSSRFVTEDSPHYPLGSK